MQDSGFIRIFAVSNQTKQHNMEKNRLSNKTIEVLKEVESKYSRNNRMWATGYSLPSITKALAEALGNKKVLVHVPYHTFVCKGNATTVDSDVRGLMPFSSTRKSVEECSTLFYGDRAITRGNYLPFQSSCDAFYITKIEILDGYVDVRLEKADNAGMFM